MSQWRLPDHRKPYPHPEMPGVYCVPLTRKMIALIDAQDAPKVGEHRWTFSACNGFKGGVQRSTIAGQRQLSRVLTGAKKGEVVNFRNGNPFDLRRANLRTCTVSELHQNSRKRRRPTTSRFKGVWWQKRNRKWRAAIYVNHVLIHLGQFTDELDAAEAYDAAALKHFGEFARPNLQEVSV